MDTMNRFFLLASLACALAGNVQADDIVVTEHVGEATVTYTGASATRALRRVVAQETAERMADERAEKFRLAAEWAKNHPQSAASVADGDSAKLSNTYDDDATIRIYLRDSGYSDLSEAQLAQVRDYMKAHGIRHVSQLGQ
jgi:predicted nucleic acid-binding protein